MDLKYTTNDLDIFLSTVFFDEIVNNGGGMNINDMFTFYFLLKKLQPKVIIESGVWNGFSTKLIRRTLGDDPLIICLDPRDIPSDGYVDNNKNTQYYTGSSFIDFNDIDMKKLNLDTIDSDNILCFFDDHQNSARRLVQCIKKDFKHIFFNDNYPINAGSHYSIQHLIDNDQREKFDIFNQYSYSLNTFPQINLNHRELLIQQIKTYIVFPNIFSSEISLLEGTFQTVGFFNDSDTEAINKYSMFYKHRQNYNWNTYLTI